MAPSGDFSDRGLRYLIIAAIGSFIFVCALLLLVFMGARLPFGTLIVASLAAMVPVPISAMLILWLDRHEREPAGLLVAAFLWGAVVAIVFSLIINTGFSLIVIASAGWKREVRIIRESLSDEVARGTVTEAEIDVLCNWRERLRRLIGALGKNPAAWLALRQLYELQVDLGFRKWQASRGERLMSFQQTLTDDDYRVRITEVRTRLAAMGVSGA